MTAEHCQSCGAELVADSPRCQSCGAPRSPSPQRLRTVSETPTSIAELVRTSGAPLAGLSAAAADLSSLGEATLLRGASAPQPTMRMDAVVSPAAPQPTLIGAAHTVALRAVSDTPGGADGRAARAVEVAPPYVRPTRGVASRAVPLVALLATAAVGLVAAVVALRGATDTAPVSVAAVVPISAEVVELPAGEFTLGLSEDNKEIVLALCYQLSSSPGSECRLQYLRDIGELPARTVAFDAIGVDAFEVSNAQYEVCVGSGACTARDLEGCTFYTVARGREVRAKVPESMLRPDHPAVCVTFDEAAAHCASRGMRLPTAAEWERAARSGDDRLQPWGRFAMPGLLNWGERVLGHFPIPGRVDGFELTAPVNEYRSGANDHGIHNLLGNAAEWVVPREGDPEGHGGVRGGSYVDDFRNLRLTYHDTVPRHERRSTLGFRCVR